MYAYILIDDLKKRNKRRRISNWKGSIAQIFQIKPILYMTKEGEVHVRENVRGRKRQLKRIVDIIEKDGKNLSKYPLYILHVRAKEEELNFVKEEIENRLKPRNNYLYSRTNYGFSWWFWDNRFRILKSEEALTSPLFSCLYS